MRRRRRKEIYIRPRFLTIWSAYRWSPNKNLSFSLHEVMYLWYSWCPPKVCIDQNKSQANLIHSGHHKSIISLKEMLRTSLHFGKEYSFSRIPEWSPRTTWWKEKTGSCKVSSDIYTHMCTHTISTCNQSWKRKENVSLRLVQEPSKPCKPNGS